MSERTLRGMLQRHFRVAHLQHKVLRTVDHILYRHADLNDVLVLGQHHFTQARCSNFRGVDLNDFINQRWIPLQAWRQCGVVFTKAQHNRTLLLIELVETHQAPDQEDAAEDNA